MSKTREEYNDEIDALIDMAEHFEKKCEDLIARYGEGVRPGWVSADLAIDGQTAKNYRREAHELTEERDREAPC